MNETLLAAGVAVLAVCWGILVFALSNSGTSEAFGMCAPARYDSLTGQPTTAPRRIVVQLGPPACAALQTPAAAQLPPPGTAWDDELHDWVVPQPQPRRQQAAYCSLWRDDPPTAIRENSYTYDLARVTAVEPDELDAIDDLDVPDELDDWGDDPDELSVVAPNRPRLKPVEQPSAVEPEPVPVVVGRTAARFAALEIERGRCSRDRCPC